MNISERLNSCSSVIVSASSWKKWDKVECNDAVLRKTIFFTLFRKERSLEYKNSIKSINSNDETTCLHMNNSGGSSDEATEAYYENTSPQSIALRIFFIIKIIIPLILKNIWLKWLNSIRIFQIIASSAQDITSRNWWTNWWNHRSSCLNIYMSWCPIEKNQSWLCVNELNKITSKVQKSTKKYCPCLHLFVICFSFFSRYVIINNIIPCSESRTSWRKRRK